MGRTGRRTAPFPIALDFYRYFVFANPDWDWKTMDFDKDVAPAGRRRRVLNAKEPDLRAFKARSGKLIMYHGWSDQVVPPQHSIHYYDSVEKTVGARRRTIRLFMVPGMTHCGGGPGPNTFDSISAIEQWVEKGKAPEQMIASHSSNGAVDRTRPLCPYPQIATYNGSGSIDEAANFVCK